MEADDKRALVQNSSHTTFFCIIFFFSVSRTKNNIFSVITHLLYEIKIPHSNVESVRTTESHIWLCNVYKYMRLQLVDAES